MSVSFNDLHGIARAVVECDSPHEAVSAWGYFDDKGPMWRVGSARVADWIKGGMVGDTPFSVFVNANTKLDFPSFSVLPLYTCPGAGECASWCYSFKGWRSPQAFMRQVQNTLLMRFGRDRILSALDTLKAGFVRLYVDGDFSSVDDVSFWMDALRDRPHLKAYGYSKSFLELLEYYRGGGVFPPNYTLNISGGHRHGPDVVAAVRELPCVRGDFIALAGVRHVPTGRDGRESYVSAVRSAMGRAAFTCPGKCGSCTGAGPVCAIQSARVPVVIGIH